MKKSLIFIFLSYFLIFAQIYSVWNFLFQIVSQTGVISPKKYSMIYSFFIFQLLNILISNIADKKGIHKNLIFISTILSGFLVLLIYNLDNFCNQKFRFLILVFLYTIYLVVQVTGFFLIDNLTFNFFVKNNIDLKNFGKIRLAGTLGNMSVQVLNLFLGKYINLFKKTNRINKIGNKNSNYTYDHLSNIVFCIFFGILAAF